VELVPILPDVNGSHKFKMAAVKPDECISARKHDRIEIATASTMFSRMANSMALRRMLSDVSGSRNPKMAAVKPEN